VDEAVLLYTTWPEAETAAPAGREAVAAGLAACVNLFAPHRAIYRWEGAVEEVEESAALFKTSRAGAPALRDWILARHPYALPAVVALEAGEGSSPAYLAWLAAASQPPRGAAMTGGDEETR
jgi:periplasmic divalent cation tolerance protein